ncbi:MAG: hypothetical protein EBE86_000470 [Hormoscilla sp. GUM202]|nr:hypothetical protein [Hormoscilla sp. GUM202]
MNVNFEPKILKQLAKRGWTVAMVQATINNPYRTVATNDTKIFVRSRSVAPAIGNRNNDPATAYINQDNSYVVRNDNTGTVVQISNRNDSNWKSPF